MDTFETFDIAPMLRPQCQDRFVSALRIARLRKSMLHVLPEQSVDTEVGWFGAVVSGRCCDQEPDSGVCDPLEHE